MEAANVVLASPASDDPAKCRVLRVFIGDQLKEGDIFEMDEVSLNALALPVAEDRPEKKRAHPKEAILFLGPREPKGPPRFPLAGLRLRTVDGNVYLAECNDLSWDNSLHSYPHAIVWDDLVRKVAADAAEIHHILSLKEINEAHRRNQALLDWVEHHRSEFGGGLQLVGGDEPTNGWGSLEQDVFRWILASDNIHDIWAAVDLYAQLNRGGLPGGVGNAFATSAGRDLLLSVGTDNGILIGRRVRALELLSYQLWPQGRKTRPGAERLDSKEQAALIDRVAPLLKQPDQTLRIAAASLLLDASAPPGEALESCGTQRALPALLNAYKDQPPGPARNALARAVNGIAGAKQWQELTGNGQGLLAVFEDPGTYWRGAMPDLPGRQTTDFYCWLAFQHWHFRFGVKATLVLEQLDEKGKVVESKEVADNSIFFMPTAPDRPEVDYPAYVNLSMAGFTPGLWRMTARGVAEDGGKWTSEPRILRLNPPPQPGQPPSLAPRIVFDP
ncbi:MAG TPA: hypothetical protein VMS17_00585 [Gemmataceae bacterium]|nr:hypothetical protein [Gemmataceae bacterium]